MDSDSELIARIEQECLGSHQDEAILCRLIRHPVRLLLDHSGAVVQLQTTQGPGRIVGIDVAPRLVRSLRLAARTVEGGAFLSRLRTTDPLVIPTNRLRTLRLGPHLRQLSSGTLVLHGHTDSAELRRSVFAFTGVNASSPNRVQYIVKAITPSLHRAFFAMRNAESPPVPALTPAEMAICRLLLKGASNKTIAKVLGKSYITVRNQLSGVFVKLGVSTRTSAAARLRELHIDLGDRDARAKSALIEHLYY